MAADGGARGVILLAGPSGSGKSTLVRAVGLPIVYLTTSTSPPPTRPSPGTRSRDLRERRKPPVTIARRGIHFQAEQDLVAAAVAAGCRPLDAPGTRMALAAARDL